jgi:tetratricopeptide (TPR) repeat protein
MRNRSRRLGALILLFPTLAISPDWARQVHSAAGMAKSGWQAFEDGRASEAKASLAEAVRLSPRHPSYQAALAEIDWSLQDAQGAIRHFEIAVKLNPADTAVRSRLAQVYQSLGRDLEVVRILQAADPPEPLRSVWRFSRGFSLFRLGRMEAARREFLTLVSHPEFAAPVNFFLGRIAYTRNHFEEALPFFAKAVRLGDSPTNREFSSYTYDYGLTLFRLGRYSEANTQFSLSSERYALEPLTWMMRGRCEEELSNYRAAIDDYEESIRIDPKFELSYYHLARLQQRYGDKHRADELFKHLQDLRQGDLSEAQIRAEEEAALKMKNGTSVTHSTSVPAP